MLGAPFLQTNFLYYYQTLIIMKYYAIIFLVTLLASCGPKVGPNVNSNGFMADGYDVTEYFEGNAVEGSNQYTTTYDGAKYKFISQANLDTFSANPEKYEPQYNGYCAYAVGAQNKKIGINPESYEIRDGKLYLFYDTAFSDTKKKWEEEGPEQLQAKADENWKTLEGKQ